MKIKYIVESKVTIENHQYHGIKETLNDHVRNATAKLQYLISNIDGSFEPTCIHIIVEELNNDT